MLDKRPTGPAITGGFTFSTSSGISVVVGEMNSLGRQERKAAVTPERLEAMWPEAHRRIVTSLCAVGIERDAAEEAMAEAATRALARGLVVGDVDEFCRWAYVVARNVVADGKRRSKRVVLTDVVPDRPDTYDLATHVETRDRLVAAGRALAGMSPLDREAIIDGVDGVDGRDGRPERKVSVRHAVRLHRARSRLLRALGAPAGWRLPRWAWRVSRTPPEVLAAALALPLMTTTALLASPSSASADWQGGDNPRTTAAHGASTPPTASADRSALHHSEGHNPAPLSTRHPGTVDAPQRGGRRIPPVVPHEVKPQGSTAFAIEPVPNVYLDLGFRYDVPAVPVGSTVSAPPRAKTKP